MANCSKEGCTLEALWGTDVCSDHLEKKGENAVQEWREKVIKNKENLIGANLNGANLQGANLSRANLQESDLSGGAYSVGADFIEANLQNANLSLSHLQGAKLLGANLQGADLRFTYLKDTILSYVKYTTGIRLPVSVKNILLCMVNFLGTRATYGIIGGLFSILLIIPFITGLKLKPRVWLVCPIILWPFLIMLIIRLIGFRLEKLSEKLKSKIKTDSPDTSPELVRRIVAPTLWRNAVVDAVGFCDPIDLRYIKDQSYLEALEAKAESRLQKFWMFLWGITCGYGSYISLWILWSLMFVLSFGSAYSLGEGKLWVLNVGGQAATWFTPFYFSVVTFTTLGLGDVTPAGHLLGEIIVTVEVILGYVMLGGLISIFANKLARLA